MSAANAPGSHVIVLPYTKPPLTLNQRLQHFHEYRLKSALIDSVIVLARAGKLPKMLRAEVELHYAPATWRRRDPDNLSPTHKVCVDGLVRAGIVPDDTSEYVYHKMPVIDQPNAGRGRLYLLVREIG